MVLARQQMLTQVTFHFPTDTEIRYLEQRPCRGDRVRGRCGELFVVAQVDREGDTYLARCVTPVEYASDARRLSRTLRTLAHEMRGRAGEIVRRTLEQQERTTRRESDITQPPSRR